MTDNNETLTADGLRRSKKLELLERAEDKREQKALFFRETSRLCRNMIEYTDMWSNRKFYSEEQLEEIDSFLDFLEKEIDFKLLEQMLHIINSGEQNEKS